jgi:capsular polysaccharide export protein
MKRPLNSQSMISALPENGFFQLTQHKRLLLLQGPIGPFFAYLHRFLHERGLWVHKINFNGGDCWFHRADATDYRGNLENWPDWLHDFMIREQVDGLVLFGQFRPVHEQARMVAQQLGIKVFVFEEGYVRPDYVTLEANGVNALSRFPRDQAFFQKLPHTELDHPRAVKHRFWRVMLFVMIYYIATFVMRWRFREYTHHRSMNLLTESVAWWVSGGRKWYYRWKERDCLAALSLKEADKSFFLVPLQVHNDSQLIHHSPYSTIEEMIHEVIYSFMHHAPKEARLVFKHHPMDRGYKHYGRLISQLASRHGLADRLIYIQGGHLPSLLRQAIGVVTINSTVGLSALHHHTPTKLLGEAVYDVKGLVSDKSLDEFWSQPCAVDVELYEKFRVALVHSTQLNMGFYTPSSYAFIEHQLST